MYTKDAIRYSLNLADQAVMLSLETIEDAPLTFPTENDGCHPLWVVGHLAFVEGLTHEMLGGGSSPVGDWAAIFGQDTVPAADAARYQGSVNQASATSEKSGHHSSSSSADGPLLLRSGAPA
jgi:hypothetical protein